MDSLHELISIVVPVFNVKPYIERCINSLISQTHSEIEIILVDDGSTDGSEELCDRISETDSRIYVFHQKNQGITRARKTGIERASGKYIGFVDPDDWVESDTYETMVKRIIRSNADIVCAGMMREKNGQVYDTWKGSGYPNGVYKGDDLHKLKTSLFKDGTIHISGSMCNKLFKKELLEECISKVDDRLRGVGDDDACVVPYVLRSNCVVLTNEAFYHGCDRVGSASHCRYETWYLQSNLYYIRLKESIIEAGLESELMDDLNKVWLKEIIYGLDQYFPNTYNFRFPNCFEHDRRFSIVIYGAGCVGKNYYTQFQKMKNISLTLWVDRNFDNIKDNPKGSMVCQVNELKDADFDYIIIANNDEGIAMNIKKDLQEMFGIDSNKILWEKPIPFVSYFMDDCFTH